MTLTANISGCYGMAHRSASLTSESQTRVLPRHFISSEGELDLMLEKACWYSAYKRNRIPHSGYQKLRFQHLYTLESSRLLVNLST